MKPIFEAGDFTDWPFSEGRCQVLAEHCNAKLTSLGIDAETPEKLKRVGARGEVLGRRDS